MLIMSIAFFIVSVGVLVYYRNSVKQNFFFKRAPQLRIADLKASEEAWITGIVNTAKVVVTPFFQHESVYYEYSLHEKKIKYETDIYGRPTAVESWELTHTQSESTSFSINDGSGKILVDPDKAHRKFLMSETHQTETQRHTLSYFPASGLVSAVGAASKNNNKLIQKGKIALMITPFGRKQFLQAIENEERLSKYGGFSLMLLSLTVAFVHILNTFHVAQSPAFRLAIIVGFLGVLPIVGTYYYFTFNSLINFRRNVLNSWANVDVELKARRDLIPNLITSFEAHLAHEKNSFTALARLRESLLKEKRLASRIKFENEISEHLAKIEAAVTVNPELNKGSTAFISKKLKALESKISEASVDFNRVAEEYNHLAIGFPSEFIARRHKFGAFPFYGERKADQFVAEETLSATEVKKAA